MEHGASDRGGDHVGVRRAARQRHEKTQLSLFDVRWCTKHHHRQSNRMHAVHMHTWGHTRTPHVVSAARGLS